MGKSDNVHEIVIKPVEEKIVRGRYWTREERRQWSITLFVGSGMLYACRTVMPLCVVAISKELGWDKTDSGTVLSCFFWGYTMTQFLGGYLSDRIGGDVVLPIAAICWSLLTFWTPVVTYIGPDKHIGLAILVTLRVLLGMSQGFHYPSLASVIARKVSEKERSFTFSLVTAGSSFGTLLCGSIGSVLLDHYGWALPFYACGIAGLCWMLFLRYYVISRYRTKYMISDEDSVILVDKSQKTKEERVPWLTLLSKPAFWSLLVGHFCQNNAFYILLSWLPTYFHENYPSAKPWIFNVVPWVVTIPSTILSGMLADHLIATGYSTTFVRKLIESVSMLGMAMFLSLIGFISSFSGALFCMAGAICCSGFHNSGIAVNPQDIAPNNAGSVFGIMNMAGAIPGFVGVYIAGHILEATKSWVAVFNQTAVVCLFGWLVFTIFGTGKRLI